MSTSHVLNVPPLHYIHVLDNNTNITRLEIGPQRFTAKQHEHVVEGPTKFIVVPPHKYCIISNPVVSESRDSPPYKLRWRDSEVRFSQPPFPLYPGESAGSVLTLTTVPHSQALLLNAERDFTDTKGVERKAGEEWLFYGPATYLCRKEERVVKTVYGQVVKQNSALRVRAVRDTKDHEGNVRTAGEEWLVRRVGLYMPSVDEEVVGEHQGHVLTREVAIHLEANRSFTDQFGTNRAAGDEWLVTNQQATMYIPGVEEIVRGTVSLTKVGKSQYCTVINPIDHVSGEHQMGKKQIRRGPCSFFLYPFEKLEGGVIRNAHLLSSDEAVLLQAVEEFEDNDGSPRQPGDRWMVFGPCSYIPREEVKIVETRRAIPLSSSEGIYVRNRRTGAVSAVIGKTHLLSAEEELWEKELSPLVEQLLRSGGGIGESSDIRKVQYFSDYADPSMSNTRDKTRVVSFRAPGNTAVQIYDSKTKQSRIEFGPSLILLQPYEEFTVLSLSAGKPKREGALKTLCLLLGPDFITEDYDVETADHARLRVRLAANVYFDFDRQDPKSVAALFNVPDFIGTACRTIGSRVRGRIASTTFDEFHKDSAAIISSSVFGSKNVLRFSSNGLVITNIDVQSVETTDEKTRASLQKSVQLAIEITTNSQEAAARQEADRRKQEAEGLLDLQRIKDESTQEKSRQQQVALVAKNTEIKVSGTATSEARSRAAALQISGEADKSIAQLKADAFKTETTSQRNEQNARNAIELEYKKSLYELEVQLQDELAQIEADKFKRTVEAIGRNTIQAIASAGPEMQASLLKGLGLKSVLISDGHSPVNLFKTSQGLLSQASSAASSSSAAN
mmetsp:Transcript_11215/g.16825  ORF Transcript_11215/g.16825 Transcript_11215/m.16825 type:complete len:843 (-) Transcript_11215:39-2567(-)|eukprot:CAMPEP_0201551850 /NCGR_PEP_ID=MMETSP0173_2-20130828/11124_1 /ASSEMBLY_ACC=CAM_ASM_000268 /TAXON_ID=218659 /ORGANISM="Vexillifera sp., Strain DIVA3 564/2" /LENGTH=842 /DNA_ID=CAMNT_0047962199 /DNA_START=33 /DNA_END=2561 /DNA_ORIENTATION=+